jgi:hypothetical protein
MFPPIAPQLLFIIVFKSIFAVSTGIPIVALALIPVLFFLVSCIINVMIVVLIWLVVANRRRYTFFVLLDCSIFLRRLSNIEFFGLNLLIVFTEADINLQGLE